LLNAPLLRRTSKVEPLRQPPSSSGTGDPRQRIVKLLAISRTLGRRALSQAVQFASHSRHYHAI